MCPCNIGNHPLRRADNKSHQSDIRTAARPTTDDKDFQELILRVFSHHHLDHLGFYKEKPRAFPEGYRGNVPTEEYITYRFHEKYYSVPSLQWDVGGADIPIDVFEEAISTVSEKHNTINFLTGPVGSGKTTYIFNILFRMHKNG